MTQLMALDVPILRHILDFLLFDLTEVAQPSAAEDRLVTAKIAKALANEDPLSTFLPSGIALANRRLASLALGCAVRRQRELQELRSREP
ncbi:hypothetical protein FOL47_002525 [Perkinsus chesapeaki]|uniref:Uncharacterized protein n=1 Tax=Perkinsus chesapeaki TaxID=330153 RepID=A0A7J6N0P3_PERCH|nr:hypothetical protein FOL47_002525 [Perkinsus chesapeaki]